MIAAGLVTESAAEAGTGRTVGVIAAGTGGEAGFALVVCAVWFKHGLASILQSDHIVKNILDPFFFNSGLQDQGAGAHMAGSTGDA